MLQGFSGQFPQKVDGKGRMSIPAPLRRVLEAGDPAWADGLGVKLHINYNPRLDRNLRVYSVASLQRVFDYIGTLPDGLPLKVGLNKMYNGFTDEATMDKDGRIVLPQRLREKLGVDTDAELTLMGLGEYVEIWRTDVFEASIGDELDALFADLGKGVDPLSLIPAELAKLRG